MNAALAVLDLFSAAAGGWSLGMHRAGFRTVAACEWVEWRRALYLQNNPGVRMYDDVRTLTGEQLLRDIGFLPSVVVGSPPCQDISPANTKGKGVEGERSGLYFEAVRIIGEVRPRWFALENSANLRTRGADLVLAALEELGYACWSFVVRAGDGKGGAGIGANHERPRSWLIGCDLAQVTDADGFGWHEGWQGRGRGFDLSFPQNTGHAAGVGHQPWPGDSESERGKGDRRFAGDHAGNGQEADASDASEAEWRSLPIGGSNRDGQACERGEGPSGHAEHAQARIQHAGHADSECSAAGIGPSPDEGRDALGTGRLRQDADDQRGDPLSREGFADADQEGQADGPLEPSLRQAQEPDDGRGSGRSDDGQSTGEVGLCEADRGDAFGRRADWSLDDLADHLQLDDGLSAWLAGTRIAVGGPRGTVAASLIVEAFGDAVVPQIPEAIGRAILRTERALAAVYARPVDERAVA